MICDSVEIVYIHNCTPIDDKSLCGSSLYLPTVTISTLEKLKTPFELFVASYKYSS